MVIVVREFGNVQMVNFDVRMVPTPVVGAFHSLLNLAELAVFVGIIVVMEKITWPARILA